MEDVKSVLLEDLIDANIIMAKAQLINDIVWAFRKAILLRESKKENWKKFWELGMERFRNFDKNLKEFEETLREAYELYKRGIKPW